MKILKLLKTYVAPTANEQLAKLDTHLLTDLGFIKTYTRTDSIRVPADLGVRPV